jgi:hypothetical protein
MKYKILNEGEWLAESNVKRKRGKCMIWGSHSGGYEESTGLHGVISQKRELFREIMSSYYSESRNSVSTFQQAMPSF